MYFVSFIKKPYFYILALGIVNVVSFQNCSNWNGKVSILDNSNLSHPAENPINSINQNTDLPALLPPSVNETPQANISQTNIQQNTNSNTEINTNTNDSHPNPVSTPISVASASLLPTPLPIQTTANVATASILPSPLPNVTQTPIGGGLNCIDGEISFISCPGNPGASNKLICKQGIFIDENGKDDCVIPDLNPVINAIHLTSPGPLQVKIDIDASDDHTLVDDLSIYYLGSKINNNEIITVQPGLFILHAGDIKVIDNKMNSVSNSQEMSISVATLKPLATINNLPTINSVNISSENCLFAVNVNATDKDGDKLKYFLNGSEFIPGSFLQISKSQDLIVGDNLSVADLDLNGNIKSIVKFSGNVSKKLICDIKPPLVKLNLEESQNCEKVIATVVATDESTLSYSYNNGNFQNSNIFEIAVPSGQKTFSLSSQNVIVVKDFYNNKTIVNTSATINVKSCTISHNHSYKQKREIAEYAHRSDDEDRDDNDDSDEREYRDENERAHNKYNSANLHKNDKNQKMKCNSKEEKDEHDDKHENNERKHH